MVIKCKRSCGFWMVMIIIIISHAYLIILADDHLDGGGGCIEEEERKSLLEFKAAWLQAAAARGLNSFLTSWVDHHHDCCDGSWEGVTCDSVTGHVLQLSLGAILSRGSDLNSTGRSMEAIGTGIQKLSTLKQLEYLLIYNNQLHASVLSSLSTLKSLKIIDLSGNHLFNDGFSSQECEPLLKLKKLEELYLSDNINDIPSSYEHKKINVSCLGSLSSLRKLSLSENYFMDDHNFFNEVLESLQQIEELDLAYCNLTSEGGGVMRTFSKKMVKLRNLDLSYNQLQKDVLATLGALPYLQNLQLSYNPSIEGPLTNQDLIGYHHLEILNLDGCRLNGSIPQSLCEMNKLQELDLSYNLLQDIPICLNKLSFLKYFNVQNNQLSGNISSSLFRDLNSLKYINLRDNSLQGSFSLRTFANFSKLEEILINSYSNKLVIESDLVDWVPKFQLKNLKLSNCNLKEFPKFLHYQKDLRFLDLSHNKVEGSFSNWLLVNNTKLDVLSMRDNNLDDNIFYNLFNWSLGRRNLESIDISYSNMSGQIPRTITVIV
ncbi:receptor-like protein 14 [Impatiens glandulifera]|uniref:receptor-like protein 14 n=1 Tax=Impatiens glandulifera TaxID=253017 RepID=UPI001FB0B6DD|nr:receptor-like protein 14 [Impatiens glandulifera]